jgi:hypothetical protein
MELVNDWHEDIAGFIWSLQGLPEAWYVPRGVDREEWMNYWEQRGWTSADTFDEFCFWWDRLAGGSEVVYGHLRHLYQDKEAWMRLLGLGQRSALWVWLNRVRFVGQWHGKGNRDPGIYIGNWRSEAKRGNKGQTHQRSTGVSKHAPRDLARVPTIKGTQCKSLPAAPSASVARPRTVEISLSRQCKPREVPRRVKHVCATGSSPTPGSVMTLTRPVTSAPQPQVFRERHTCDSTWEWFHRRVCRPNVEVRCEDAMGPLFQEFNVEGMLWILDPPYRKSAALYAGRGARREEEDDEFLDDMVRVRGWFVAFLRRWDNLDEVARRERWMVIPTGQKSALGRLSEVKPEFGEVVVMNFSPWEVERCVQGHLVASPGQQAVLEF